MLPSALFQLQTSNPTFWRKFHENWTKIKNSYQYLTFTTLWVNSADNKLMIFCFPPPPPLPPPRTGFDISCKLSPVETIYMKCQNLFSGKNKKNISVCCLLKSLPRMLSAESQFYVYSRFRHLLWSGIIFCNMS